MADFPPSGVKEDSSKFSISFEDPVVRGEVEGGYVTTRARHTRRPRRTFTTGFTDMTPAQILSLENFYDSKRGGSVAFTYAHPTTGTVFTVRFKGFSENYSGAGSVFRWDVGSVQLEEV